MSPVPSSRLRSLALCAGVVIALLGTVAFLGLQILQGRQEWAVRAGEPRSATEALFDDAATPPSRYQLLGQPERVAILKRSLVLETYRDTAHGPVSVVTNASFNFEAGVWQGKTFSFFSGFSLAAVIVGLFLWGAHFLLPKRKGPQ